MHKTSSKKWLAELKKAATRFETGSWVLRLYVAGMTPRSTRAVANIRKLCEDFPARSFDLQVIDIYQQPRLAQGEQIIAVPTLVKKLPLPLRRFIGDMTDTDKIVVGLDLREETTVPAHDKPVSRAKKPKTA